MALSCGFIGSLHGSFIHSFRSSLANLAAAAVAASPQVLLHDPGCGPVIDILSKPGVLFTDLSDVSINNLVMGSVEVTKAHNIKNIRNGPGFDISPKGRSWDAGSAKCPMDRCL